MATIDDVLTLWFGAAPANDAAALGRKLKRWYGGGPEEDAAIREHFADTVKRALAGELDDWAQTPRGGLALILLLDQMPRALFRGTPRAYAGDEKALQLATEMLLNQRFEGLTFEQRHFIYMPLLHAEDAVQLDRFNQLFPRSLESVPDWARPLLADGMEQGMKYRDVIARFGRFPHRNEVLGRPSTPEELEFLKTWDQRAKPQQFKSLG